jgi:hypothetical protein
MTGISPVPADAGQIDGGVRFLGKPFLLADMVSLVSDLLTGTGSKSATPGRPC